MKAPLIVLTTIFTLAFLNGAIGFGFTDGFYAFIGFASIATVIWMWVIEARNSN